MFGKIRICLKADSGFRKKRNEVLESKWLANGIASPKN